jgi:phosphoribosylaminoimidazolecarboxamide formyltransferase/IMP cyclohydrolase
VRRALLSVYDKTGIVDFAAGLIEAGVGIVSSGGTARLLTDAGLAVTEVSDVTGSPEILGGRVKTLHPKIHGGILARPGEGSDEADLADNSIEMFQLVVTNLYPFRETLAKAGPAEPSLIEMIDIGGPAMIRAAAKNHRYVAVVVSPDQYPEVLASVQGGGLDDEQRRQLAAHAFFTTASYDAAIVSWLGGGLVLPLKEVRELRYGENPHQAAAVYQEDGSKPWWAVAIQHQGKEMSFNNYADAEAAWRLVADLPEPAVSVIKHTNPAGVAHAASVSASFQNAWDGDPVSAFGSVVGVNGKVDAETAGLIVDRFIEVVVCRSVTAEALTILSKKANLRVLEAPLPDSDGRSLRQIEGGFLVQDHDSDKQEVWNTVSDREPTEEEMEQMRFAMTVALHTKSNAIVICKDFAAVGVGAGDQSRVGAGVRAVAQAGERAVGAVAASDAFFPFRDGVDTLVEAGVTAIVEPGGSRNDQEIIDAANEHGIALVFSQNRHFKH